MATSLMPDVAELPILEPEPERNCPFYGHYMALIGKPFTLIDIGPSNGCALWSWRGHSPCYMEVQGDRVEWRRCERVADITTGLDKAPRL